MFYRYKLHETKRQCKRIGSSTPDCGKALAARQGCLRGSWTGRCLTVLGAPMERSSEKRRRRCLESKAASGTSMSSVEPTEKAVTENPSKRATCCGLFHRTMDLPAGGRGNRPDLWGEVSSRPCLVHPAFAGLELSKARTASPRTRRAGHSALATAGLAAYKKKRVGRDIASFFRMRAALCCCRFVQGFAYLNRNSGLKSPPQRLWNWPEKFCA